MWTRVAIAMMWCLWGSTVLHAQGTGSTDQVIYRKSSTDERPSFTNAVEQIPVDQREQRRVDLSGVSLNGELAAEVERQLEEEHASLVETEYCEHTRDAAARGLLWHMWDEYAPLLVCGGVLLCFLLFTPIGLKRFGAPAWAKTLCMVIPSLAVAGLLSFSAMKANKKMTALKQLAQPCAQETFSQLSGGPNPIQAHRELIGDLKQRIAEMEGRAASAR